MQNTPKGLRLHIGIFGRRNVGKSSLLNAITRQQVSIVSPQAGTTTDPVEKPMELLPLGPVLFIDTAGVDDEGALGEERVNRTRKAFDRTDLAVLVTDGGVWGHFEERLFEEFLGRTVPVVIVFNKCDLGAPSEALAKRLKAAGATVVTAAATQGDGVESLRAALLQNAPSDFFDARSLIADLVGPGNLAVLVVPIDKEAPKGRIILPQVQAIRDLLDGESACVVVQERGLKKVLSNLKTPPSLVVTDSQAFAEVGAIVPPSVPLTSFSILLARFQGDLVEQVRGTLAIDHLKPGDKVLVAEACTHHPIGEDIGRVKIPRWLNQYTGGDLAYEYVQGRDFPEDLSSCSLVVHCGNCMGNRREMLSRILRCRRQGIPITNYGLAIAFSLGIFGRALGPFPAARNVYHEAMRHQPGGEGA